MTETKNVDITKVPPNHPETNMDRLGIPALLNSYKDIWTMEMTDCLCEDLVDSFFYFYIYI